jgi:hypothetical protein
MPRFLLVAIVLSLLPFALSIDAARAQPSIMCPNEFQPYVGVSPKNNCPGLPPAHRFTYTVRFFADPQCDPLVGWPASHTRIDFGGVVAHPDGPTDQGGYQTWAGELTVNPTEIVPPVFVEVFIQSHWTPFFELRYPPADPCGGVRSVDGNGDNFVALADLALWQQAFVAGGPAWRGDFAQPFDCHVALADLSRWQQHFACQ